MERNKKSPRSGGLEPRPGAVATGAPRRVFIPNPENKSRLELVAVKFSLRAAIRSYRSNPNLLVRVERKRVGCLILSDQYGHGQGRGSHFSG